MALAACRPPIPPLGCLFSFQNFGCGGTAILTLAALLAATVMRSPGRAWAGLLMAALCAVVILGVGSSALRARACDSAHFCVLLQDAFLQQGAEGAAGLLAAARCGSEEKLGRGGATRKKGPEWKNLQASSGFWSWCIHSHHRSTID